MTTHPVPAAGVTLQVTDRGSGPSIVVLHGFTGSAAAMAPLTDRLERRHRVVAPDLIGHGRSDAPADVTPYRMDAVTEQVWALCDALDLDVVHLVGYSMGGRIALAAAALHPDRLTAAAGRTRLAGLTLIGASAGITDPGDRAIRAAADEALADRILTDGLAAFVDRWAENPLFTTQARLGPAHLEATRRQRLASNPQGLANSLRGTGTGAQPSLHDLLSTVTVPVCLIVGALDAKFRAIAADLAGRLPDARVVVVPGAGHAVHLEAPDACAAAVTSHVRETRT